MLEKEFQRKVIKDIQTKYPDAIIIKNDPTYIQGFPDLLVLIDNFWAALEVKVSAHASHRPNQDFFISKLNDMSFARFVYPENKEEVLNELQQSFEYSRDARFS